MGRRRREKDGKHLLDGARNQRPTIAISKALKVKATLLVSSLPATNLLKSRSDRVTHLVECGLVVVVKQFYHTQFYAMHLDSATWIINRYVLTLH